MNAHTFFGHEACLRACRAASLPDRQRSARAGARARRAPLGTPLSRKPACRSASAVSAQACWTACFVRPDLAFARISTYAPSACRALWLTVSTTSHCKALSGTFHAVASALFSASASALASTRDAAPCRDVTRRQRQPHLRLLDARDIWAAGRCAHISRHEALHQRHFCVAAWCVQARERAGPPAARLSKSYTAQRLAGCAAALCLCARLPWQQELYNRPRHFAVIRRVVFSCQIQSAARTHCAAGMRAASQPRAQGARLPPVSRRRQARCAATGATREARLPSPRRDKYEARALKPGEAQRALLSPRACLRARSGREYV